MHDYLFTTEVVRFAFMFGVAVSMVLYQSVRNRRSVPLSVYQRIFSRSQLEEALPSASES